MYHPSIQTPTYPNHCAIIMVWAAVQCNTPQTPILVIEIAVQGKILYIQGTLPCANASEENAFENP